MASTVVAFEAPEGLTLTAELYPDGSDTIANGSGDACTEATNRKGYYTFTVTESLTGWHLILIKSGSTLIATLWVFLKDDTGTYLAGNRSAGDAETWLHRIATKEFGVISNAASAAEEFTLAELGITVTYAGLDSDGNRTGVAFS